VEVAEHIDALDRESRILADAARACSVDAPIPTCPGWVMRDLLQHIGGVQRWATAHVAQARTEYIDIAQPIDMVDIPPSDAVLVDWFVDGHTELVETLSKAPHDVEAFTFLPAPSALAFWARRQAHEVAIHRADAQSASGAIEPFASDLAVDGVDELLLGFGARRRADVTDDEFWSLLLVTSDADRSWLVEVTPERITAGDGRDADDVDTTLRATASDLYLWAWNRPATDGLEITGRAELVDRWRTTLRVRWS
jgi:uncharacterized protein (TIGR03083 family)